jgi:hypothetical protein
MATATKQIRVARPAGRGTHVVDEQPLVIV